MAAAPIDTSKLIGKDVSIITNSNIRYEGTLISLDSIT